MSDYEFVMDMFHVSKERALEMIARGLNVKVLRDGAADIISSELNTAGEEAKLDGLLAEAATKLKQSANDV